MSNAILYKTHDGEQAVMALYDNALKNWSVPYETHQLPTRYGDTFVISSSSGDPQSPALILLHGSGGNSSMWAKDVGDYSRNFRVYAVDLIGEAGKSAPNRPEWNSPAFAEWLEDVLDALHIEHAALVGISQGAWTALRFAVYMPARVNSLVLLAPAGIVPDKLTFILRALLLRLMGKWGAVRLVDSLFANQVVQSAVKEGIVQTMAAFKPRIGVLPPFSDEELRRLTMPILLIGGTQDVMRDIDKIGTRLQSLVPDLTINRIKDAGHILMSTSKQASEFLVSRVISDEKSTKMHRIEV